MTLFVLSKMKMRIEELGADFERLDSTNLTKAYVLSFSQAIAEELRDSGVTVTALCPGPIETSFVAEGGLEGVKAFNNAASAESVARCGYGAMEKGKLVAIPDPKLSLLLNWVVPFLPRKVVLKISRKAMEKSG